MPTGLEVSRVLDLAKVQKGVQRQTWIDRAVEVSNDLVYNGAHRPVSLQPLEEALISEPAQLPMAQLPGSYLYIPHHLHLHRIPCASASVDTIGI